MRKMFDYLVVGAGLFGAVFAQQARQYSKSVFVIDKRNHVGGNIYTENIEGINVHKYGAHIFHTNNERVWNYIQHFASFNRFTNSPVAIYRGELYSLPFNMYTFNKIWGVTDPKEAEAKIGEQRKEIRGTPKNLEEQAISLVGRDVYEKLVKGFVMEKQNQRGVYLATGGLAEKEISQKYREDASTIRISYPYTAAILEKLADCYQQESLYEQKSELLDFRA